MTSTNQSEWDERYSESDQIWSGQPNQALIVEVADLPPGRALDVGSGEGADAVWLARRGWTVTALDVSRVALDRAARQAEIAQVQVDWVHAGVEDAPLPAAGFDLVSVQYPALRRTPEASAEHRLLAAVAPGGTLLVVHHAGIDVEDAKRRGFDPNDYVLPDNVTAVLDDQWEVVVSEERARDERAGAGAHHHRDQVLRVRRRR